VGIPYGVLVTAEEALTIDDSQEWSPDDYEIGSVFGELVPICGWCGQGDNLDGPGDYLELYWCDELPYSKRSQGHYHESCLAPAREYWQSVSR
jgi:hypothetical protein